MNRREEEPRQVPNHDFELAIALAAIGMIALISWVGHMDLGRMFLGQ